MSGLCKDCKWWSAFEGEELTSFLVPPPEGYGLCLLTGSGNVRRSNYPAAIAVDGDDYAAMLATHPDFGCVQFEPPEA